LQVWRHCSNLIQQQQAKKIIFVFLVLTLVSSLSASAFLTGMGKVNLVFASKKRSSSGGGGSGSRNDGGSSDSSSSSSSDKGGGGSTDNGGGGTDKSNGGGSGDTGNTTPPPTTTEETAQAPPTKTEDNTATPPTAENQQTTCPDGSTPDPTTGNCPTPPDNSGGTETTPPPAAATEQTSCPDGSTPDPTTGNCPPAATEQNAAPLQTLIRTCPPLPLDENGRCPGIDGGGLGLPRPPPQPTPLGDGSYQLPTVPPVPNTNTIAPICPSGSHLELNKCVVDGVKCPSGTIQDGDKCTPTPPTNTPPEEDSQSITLTTMLPNADGSCPTGTTKISGDMCLPNNVECPSGYNRIGNQCVPTQSSAGAADFKQVEVPANPDGSCPTGAYSVGSSGNAGQPGTGSIICLKNVPVETPPATPPTNTPPLQPQERQQLAPSQPECVPGFHWDNSKQQCVA
jgi:hypothetical protein